MELIWHQNLSEAVCVAFHLGKHSYAKLEGTVSSLEGLDIETGHHLCEGLGGNEYTVSEILGKWQKNILLRLLGVHFKSFRELSQGFKKNFSGNKGSPYSPPPWPLHTHPSPKSASQIHLITSRQGSGGGQSGFSHIQQDHESTWLPSWSCVLPEHSSCRTRSLRHSSRVGCSVRTVDLFCRYAVEVLSVSPSDHILSEADGWMALWHSGQLGQHSHMDQQRCLIVSSVFQFKEELWAMHPPIPHIW